MRPPLLLKNEKGFAMVLALSMIGLLTLFGVWMLVEGQTSFRVTASMERRESAFNLAEAALQLDYRCLIESAPSPSYAALVGPPYLLPLTGLSYMLPGQQLGKGTITPTIWYISYSTIPPPGWMVNWQGSSSFYTLYYQPKGEGTIPLPSNKGNATTTVSALTSRVNR
jgi:hypothetical protein